MRVADLMTPRVADCSPHESIRAAARRMVEHHCGCLPVMVRDDDRKRVVGIVTDRDLACRAVAEGLDPEQTEVRRCMSFPVHTITGDADLSECADRFTTLGVRRLVVVDGQNRCQGVISRVDLQRYVTATAEAGGPEAAGGTRPPAQTATPSSETPSFDLAPTFDPERGNPELTL